MNLSKNTVLVTGGTSGIGFEFTKRLLELGNTVLITGRDATKLEQTKKRLPGVHTFQSDVSNPDAIPLLFSAVTQKFPDLNILINNAGIMKTINVLDQDLSLKDLTQEIETNLMGPIRMVKQFLPHLKSKSNSAIVNVSSGLAFVPLPISPVYCATKAGLHSYTLSLRAQLKKTAVKIFELAPPATQTELLGDMSKEDMKGISIMSVEAMVAAAIRGMQNDQLEIRPGQSNQLMWMSRLAPGFILNQMSKTVDRMHKDSSMQ
jgi:uncharacterized oxidoreductase